MITQEILREDLHPFKNQLKHILHEHKNHGQFLCVNYIYHRRVGIRFFGKIKNCYFLTVNRRTGDFYVGHILNYQNKRKFTKVIRKNPCNYLGMISEQLSMITSPYKNNLHDGTIKRNLLSEFSYALGFHNFPEINYDMNNIELLVIFVSTIYL